MSAMFLYSSEFQGMIYLQFYIALNFLQFKTFLPFDNGKRDRNCLVNKVHF